MGYYLNNGIYPKYATLIQMVPHPTTLKEKLLARNKKLLERMSNEHLVCFKLGGASLKDLLAIGKKDLC